MPNQEKVLHAVTWNNKDENYIEFLIQEPNTIRLAVP